jgi:hypothetical protein
VVRASTFPDDIALIGSQLTATVEACGGFQFDLICYRLHLNFLEICTQIN